VITGISIVFGGGNIFEGKHKEGLMDDSYWGKMIANRIGFYNIETLPE